MLRARFQPCNRLTVTGIVSHSSLQRRCISFNSGIVQGKLAERRGRSRSYERRSGLPRKSSGPPSRFDRPRREGFGGPHDSNYRERQDTPAARGRKVARPWEEQDEGVKGEEFNDEANVSPRRQYRRSESGFGRSRESILDTKSRNPFGAEHVIPELGEQEGRFPQNNFSQGRDTDRNYSRGPSRQRERRHLFDEDNKNNDSGFGGRDPRRYERKKFQDEEEDGSYSERTKRTPMKQSLGKSWEGGRSHGARASRFAEAPARIPPSTATTEMLYGRNAVISVLKGQRRKLFKLYLMRRALGDSKKGDKLYFELCDRAETAGVEVITVGEDWGPAFDVASNRQPHNVST